MSRNISLRKFMLGYMIIY